MAGLLDFLQSPDAQLGIGLLAAGGPTTDPNQTGFGQRLNAGMQSVRDVQNQALRNKLIQSQVDENASQAAMRAQQLAMAQRQMAIQNQLLGYGDQPTGASPSATASASGVMPTTPGSADSAPTIPNGSGSPVAGMPSTPPQQQSTLDALSAQYKIPPEALKYDLVFNGGKGIADLIAKRGMPDMQVTNGYVYDRNRVQPGFLPSVSTSQDGKTSMILPDPVTGLPTVSAPQGALDTATAYARAQAGLKPIQIYNPDTKRMEFTNEAAVASGQGGSTGVGNNNPGNLRPPGASTGFQSFNSPEEGLAAIDKNLKAYGDKGINTISGVISRWAPPTENNTQAYIADVSKRLGIAPDQPIDLSNPITRQAIGTAITIHENGSRIFAAGRPSQGGNFAAGPSAPEKAASDAAAKFQSEGMTSANTYRDALNERVQQGSDLNMRLQESVKAMQLFQTGGGKETRAQVAQMAQALNMPDKVVNGIAGGDLGAMQEFNKLAVQQAMEQLKQSMGGAGRIAQAEFKVFQANNPNLDTDPNAVRKIFDFNTKIFNRDLTEQKEMTSYLQGGGDPSQWRPMWSQRQQQLGYTNPTLNAQKDGVPQSQGAPQAAGKSFKDFGYATPADAIKDAQNAMMKNPAAKGEIMKRLQAMGVQMPGTGSW